MKITKRIAEILQNLIEGNSIPASSAKQDVFEELISEGILHRKGKIKKSIQLIDKKGLVTYLKNQHQIKDLEKYVELLEDENTKRSELVRIAGDSKVKNVRTFKGFLVNSYIPIHSTLNNTPFVINPKEGAFDFIYDFENFIPNRDITIVGIENSENFRLVKSQEYLFKEINPLFVSRYPQNQSKDLIKWLQSIPNHYIHFGDFDFSGIGIYLNEYKKHLNEKSSFFIPENIDKLIGKFGNRERYNIQKENFDSSKIEESELLALIQSIHKHRKGLDQEYFII